MKETKLEQYLVKEIKKKNGLCLKLVSPGTKGVPDRIVIMPGGKTFFVEMKRVSGRIDPLQKYVHKQFNQRGHKVYVLWTKEQVNEFVKKLGDRNGDSI
ncbi:VRR-NUC domain-containing protein [Staphylococcus ursi]|uniref:VRR-NUC domain-containing protein n=1 Tax=Staphylococcus sp. MI 10-1553 TaxID=1912064 RepID=UPI0013982C14|nr:VRR-NUC domain-containing protein [Staphylococcus sp. MI 10-1553]QHW38073.1 VRR-NUC domain-containing protein [Staphylococcus sp. MI 10-1553]